MDLEVTLGELFPDALHLPVRGEPKVFVTSLWIGPGVEPEQLAPMRTQAEMDLYRATERDTGIPRTDTQARASIRWVDASAYMTKSGAACPSVLEIGALVPREQAS